MTGAERSASEEALAEAINAKPGSESDAAWTRYDRIRREEIERSRYSSQEM